MHHRTRAKLVDAAERLREVARQLEQPDGDETEIDALGREVQELGQELRDHSHTLMWGPEG